MATSLYDMTVPSYLQVLGGMVNVMQERKNRLSDLHQRLTKEGEHAEIAAAIEELIQHITEWDAVLIQRKSQAYDDVINFPNGLTADYFFLKGVGGN